MLLLVNLFLPVQVWQDIGMWILTQVLIIIVLKLILISKMKIRILSFQMIITDKTTKAPLEEGLYVYF